MAPRLSPLACQTVGQGPSRHIRSTVEDGDESRRRRVAGLLLAGKVGLDASQLARLNTATAKLEAITARLEAVGAASGIEGRKVGSAVQEASGRAAESGARSAAQAVKLRMQLTAEEVAGVRFPDKITGYTKHEIERVISRDGAGVSTAAVLDAVKNPISISSQPNGVFKVVGHNAVVIINGKGKVITAWSTSINGARIR